jgi:hypothetical protein
MSQDILPAMTLVPNDGSASSPRPAVAVPRSHAAILRKRQSHAPLVDPTSVAPSPSEERLVPFPE